MRISLEDLNFTRSDPREGRRTDRTMKSREMIDLVDSLDATVATQQRHLSDIIALLGTGAVTRDEVGTLIRDEARFTLAQNAAGGSVALSDDATIRTIRALRMKVNSARAEIQWAAERADRYRVEIHKKYSIALACLIFMMIGAPLGLFVRKGGLGTSATLAVAIFLFHWVSLANGEKLADRGFIEPWLGMWLADIVTGGIAIWLTFVVWKDLRSIPSYSFTLPWRRS